MPHLSVAVCSVVTAIAIAVYRCLIYPAFLCPMATIPTAHFSSRFSSLWLLWSRWTSQENRSVYELHKRKGPILRLSPDHLSLNCYEGGLKQIYLGGFPKSEFYPKGFENYGTFPLFAMINTTEHATRKRMFSHVFSKSNIMSSVSAQEVTRAMLFDRLLPLIQDRSSNGESLDIVPLNYAYAMDSFVNWQFGLSSGCNLVQDEAERKMYLDGFFDRERYSFEAVEIPGIVAVLRKIGIRLIPRFVDIGTENIENWNIAMCDRAEELIRSGQDIEPVNQPTVFAQALRTMGKPDEKLSTSRGTNEKYPNRNEIACEMFSDNSAAHETSGNTLTYLCYELSKRPELQARLRAELMKLDPPLLIPNLREDRVDIPAAKDVLAAPLLDAILMETLRLYPSIPGGQPRVTPAPSNSLGGFDKIPRGITVQCYAYSLHQNEDVFPNPEEWNPERWLEASPQQLAGMRRWFWAFGSGRTMCIASSFALYSMKYYVAGVYTNFTTEVHDCGDMELMDSYLAGPKGGRLSIRYYPADKLPA